MKTPYSFGNGWIRDRQRVRLVASVDVLAEKGSTLTNIMAWTGPWPGAWGAKSIPWAATRIVVAEREQRLLAMGAAGRVHCMYPPSGAHDEEIDAVDGVDRSGDFLDLRVIGQHVYACGMARQVYRREGDCQWMRADQGSVLPPGSMDVVGFTSMDGLSEDDFYAVGFEGEVWRCYRGRWNQMPGITNVILQCVRVVTPKRVYACGQAGVLLRGYADRWRAIPTTELEEGEELWSIQAYNGDVYVASEKALYKLDAQDRLRRVHTGLGEDLTHQHLHAADGVLWSFGAKDVIFTADGNTWHDATPGGTTYKP